MRATIIFVAFVILGSMRSMSQTPSSLPAFEVASVRPAGSDGPVGIFNFRNGRVEAKGLALNIVIAEAYMVQPSQVAGGPDWLARDEYDIIGIPSTATATSQSPLVSLGPKTPLTATQREMLQSLLKERFSLKVHIEKRTQIAYVMSRNNKPLLLSVAKDRSANHWFGGIEGGAIIHSNGISGKNITMSELATRLARYLSLPVVDATSLNDSYDFNYLNQDGEESDRTESIKTSLDRIGISVTRQRIPIDVVVVDKVERPSQN